MRYLTLALLVLLGIGWMGPVDPAAGQVPAGWYVAACFKTGVYPYPGDGGLFLVNPQDPGLPVPVTGLSAELTGAGSGGPSIGANSVLIRPSDGALIVGEIAFTGVPESVDLHVITLNGTAVNTHVKYPLGNGAGQVGQAALLPDGRVLVAVNSMTSGPLLNQHLGIVDLSTGTVIPVPAAGMVGPANAVALNPAGTIAYVGMWHSWVSGSVWAVPVPGGGSATLLARTAGGVNGLAVDRRGRILVATTGNGSWGFGTPPNIHRIDPNPPYDVTSVITQPSVRNAIAIDGANGNLVLSGGTTTPPVNTLTVLPWGKSAGNSSLVIQTAGEKTLSGYPKWSNGWGILSGIAVSTGP